MVVLGKAFAFAVKPVAPILTCHPFSRWPLQGFLVAFDGRFPSAHGIKVCHSWVPAVCSEEMLGMLLVEVHPFEAYVFRPFR